MPLTSNRRRLGRSPLIASDTNPLPSGLSKKDDFSVYVVIEIPRNFTPRRIPGIYEDVKGSTVYGMKEPAST